MRDGVGRATLALTGAALLVSVSVASVSAAIARPTYEAVAGNFAHMTNSTAYAAKLTKAGLGKFKVETEKVGTRTWYQVEISYGTMAAAKAEVAKLHAAKDRGGVEVDANGAN
jgi:Tfp pilus assembly major pilin PilA